VHEAVVPRTPGMLVRDEMGWARVLHDPEHRRGGAGRLRALACDGGYALYAVKDEEDEGRPAGVVRVRELVAAGPIAAATLWQHLLGLSLTRSVHWPLAPEDEPLPLMIDDQRAVRARLDDGLYVRLLDVGRALAQRSYAAAVDLVFDVADPVCPWNAGRWRLTADTGAGATCERTGAPADLALGVSELGAAYLGGTPLALLAAAGRVEERTTGAVAAATRAFRSERAPRCPETF
jgi:predicted acetyltransferase